MAAVLLFLVPAFDALAGVLVAPPVVILSDKGRTGRITVQNTATTPREVTINFAFGLPESDSLGNVSVLLQDSAITDPFSCVGWVKAFPRRLILQPNSQQVVRFVAKPPKDLANGEYWSRVVVQSKESEAAVPTSDPEQAITAKINMIMQTAIMLKYRQGDVFARLELQDTQVEDHDSTVQVMLDLKSQGTASYIGVLHCRLRDANGKLVGSDNLQLAVYRHLRRRFVFPVVGEDFVKPYQVEVEITSKGRTDIDARDMIYGNDIDYSMLVE
ncbi:MAG: hypothetical protein KKA42_13160 [candidate division Zixibacteria bacterium]|nr:hypothetical protein [candidate division Zixibacteria bacterium]